MDTTVDVSIPIDAEAAKSLQTPSQREALGRYLSAMFREGRLNDALAEAIAVAKREARAGGLTDADVDDEIEAWRADRRQ
jgi:hypothetical protein